MSSLIEMLSEIGTWKEPQYAIDISFVIDSTFSMRDDFDFIKGSIIDIIEDIYTSYRNNHKKICEFRAKIIQVSSDFHTPFTMTRFYNLIDEQDLFTCYLEKMYVVEECESCSLPYSLDALKSTITSIDWTSNGDVRRHIIIFFSNNASLPLKEFCKDKSITPDEMIRKSLAILAELWFEYVDRGAKRFILFAPPKEPWQDIEFEFEYVYRVALNELNRDDITAVVHCM